MVTLHRERNAVLVRMGCDICALEKLVAIDVNHLAVYSDCATSSYCNTLYMRSTMTLERLPHDSSGAQNLAGVSQAQYHESLQRMMAMKGSVAGPNVILAHDHSNSRYNAASAFTCDSPARCPDLLILTCPPTPSVLSRTATMATTRTTRLNRDLPRARRGL